MISPTGYVTLGTLWHQVAAQRYMCRPQIEVATELVTGGWCFAWIILHWNSERPGPHMLRPEKWHTTLLRFSFRPDGTAPDAKDSLQGQLTTMLYMTIPGGQLELEVTRPPWRKSWTFGLGGTCKTIVMALLHSSRRLTQIRMPAAIIADDREMHVSWN